jgi:hypothetical protein
VDQVTRPWIAGAQLFSLRPACRSPNDSLVGETCGLQHQGQVVAQRGGSYLLAKVSAPGVLT